MTVQCPRCELVFASRAEAEAHLHEDHQGRVERATATVPGGRVAASTRG